MIKISTVRKQLEEIFDENRIRYESINQKNKKLSIPMYMLYLRIVNSQTDRVERQIPVMVAIFKSEKVIYFESFNIYHIRKKEYLRTLKMINLLNQYALPGKFFIDDDNDVSYRCILDYSDLENISKTIVGKMLDSIPSACYMLLDEIGNQKSNEKK